MIQSVAACETFSLSYDPINSWGQSVWIITGILTKYSEEQRSDSWLDFSQTFFLHPPHLLDNPHEHFVAEVTLGGLGIGVDDEGVWDLQPIRHLHVNPGRTTYKNEEKPDMDVRGSSPTEQKVLPSSPVEVLHHEDPSRVGHENENRENSMKNARVEKKAPNAVYRVTFG